MSTPLSRAEFMALAEIAKARRAVTVNMFSGTQLKFGRSEALKAANNLHNSGKKLKSDAEKLKKGGKAAAKVASVPGMREAFEDFMVQCADVDGIQDIIEVIGSQAVTNLVAEATPILGVITSSAKLAKASKVVAQDGYNLYKSGEYKKGFLRGDPYAAAEAVQTIIKRDLTRNSVKLGQNAAATGAKIAGLFADLGTATTVGIGIANTMASIGLELVSIGLDIADMRAGNARLRKPDSLDLTVFEECPLLGCYLITCADTSAVANFFVADIGLPGWMDKVERMKKQQMDPMLKLATKNIQASRLQLDGLSANKGTHTKKGFFASIKSKALKRVGAG